MFNFNDRMKNACHNYNCSYTTFFYHQVKALHTAMFYTTLPMSLHRTREYVCSVVWTMYTYDTLPLPDSFTFTAHLSHYCHHLISQTWLQRLSATLILFGHKLCSTDYCPVTNFSDLLYWSFWLLCQVIVTFGDVEQLQGIPFSLFIHVLLPEIWKTRTSSNVQVEK